MNFEGSITPPLSDDEDWNSCIDTTTLPSPVLKQKSSKSKVVIAKSCEPNLDDLYYQASADLLVLEKQVSGESFSSKEITDIDQVDKFLQSVSSMVLNDDANLPFDFQSKILELIFAFSNEVSASVQDNLACLTQNMTFSQSYEDSLHHCGKVNLIKLFHCFCNVNSLLLDVVRTLEDKYVLQNFLVYHSNGLLVSADVNILNKTVNRILQDVAYFCVSIFLSQFISNNAKAKWYFTYPCSCFKNLVSKCSLLLKPEEFWVLISTLVNSCIPSSNVSKSNVTPSHHKFDDIHSALSFSWWWIKGLPYADTSCCHNLTNRLLRLSLANCLNTDLSFHIACYQKVITFLHKCSSSQQWKPAHLAGFHLLWQSMSQRMSARKKTSKKAIDSSVQEWVKQSQKLQNYFVENIEVPNNFEMFLSVFDFLLSVDEGKVWILIRDRFFLRLQPSIMKQLDETGLQHYVATIMVVMQRCPVIHGQAALEKFVVLLDNCLIDPFDLAKHKVCISGLYAVVHICIARRIERQPLSLKLGHFFRKLSKLIADNSLKSEQRHLVVERLSHFLNSCEEFLRLCDVFPSDLSLVVPLDCVTRITSKLLVNESRVIFGFLSELMMCSRMKVADRPQLEKFCLLFIQEIRPWLKKLALNSQDFCQFMTDLTLFLSSKYDSVAQVVFCDLWTFFASDGPLDVSFRLSYLNNCLKNKSLFDRINTTVGNEPHSKQSLEPSDIAIRGWISSVVVLHDSQPELVEALSTSMSKLAAFSAIISSTNLTFEIFLDDLAARHRESKTFLERVTWTKRAKVWFNLAVDIALKYVKNEKFLCPVYSAMGSIIQRCSLLLHTGKPSFVSRCLDNFVLHPPKVKSSEHTDSIVFIYLHKFIIGCLTIGSKDVYIVQVLKQIVNMYVTKWPCLSATGEKHPFLRVLLSPPNENALLVFLFALYRVLTENFYTKTVATVVEILYLWASQTSTTIDRCLLPDFPLALTNIRPHLRFSESLLKKIEFLLKFFLS